MLYSHHCLLWVTMRSTQVQKVISVLTAQGLSSPKPHVWVMFLRKTIMTFHDCITPVAFVLRYRVFTCVYHLQAATSVQTPFSLVVKHGNEELNLQMSSPLHHPLKGVSQCHVMSCLISRQRRSCFARFLPALLLFNGFWIDVFFKNNWSLRNSEPRQKRDCKITVSSKIWACVFLLFESLVNPGVAHS